MLVASACRNHGGKSHETAYVSAPQTFLRDRVATVYNKVATVKNGDRLEVLERTNNKRFVHVRIANGTDGWVEQRSLVGEDVFAAFQKLATDNAKSAIQAQGITHSETNLHVTPGRETEHLYQLSQGGKVALIRRAVAEKTLPGGAPAKPKPASGKASEATDAFNPILEDWWLVRDDQGRVGWVLARLIDLDIPLEIAQYAEGQRMVAFFVLREAQDTNEGVTKPVPEYLVLSTEPKDGQDFDFNQIRVFTWNGKHHRYETAYREHHLDGQLPVTAGHEDFGKEGNLPVFTLHVKDDDGKVLERKYKMNGPIVRRVYAAGEETEKASRAKRR
jgi:SH3-like domain-containing protein